MIVFALSTHPFALDMKGVGAYKSGGRWNHKGIRGRYVFKSDWQAIMEFALMNPFLKRPRNLVLVELEIPDDCVSEADDATLNFNWDSWPRPIECRDFGSAMIQEGRTMVTGFPSMLRRSARVYFLNTAHVDVSRVRIVGQEDYYYDPNIFRMH